MQTSCFPAVTANLFFVSAARQIPYPNCRPAKLRHNLCNPSKSGSSPIALRDIKKIQQRLTADAFQLVKEVNFAPHTLQTQAPRISRLCRDSFRFFFS
jgi:hypothetical protein